MRIGGSEPASLKEAVRLVRQMLECVLSRFCSRLSAYFEHHLLSANPQIEAADLGQTSRSSVEGFDGYCFSSNKTLYHEALLVVIDVPEAAPNFPFSSSVANFWGTVSAGCHWTTVAAMETGI